MKLGIGTYTYMWSIGFAGAKPDKPLNALGLVEKARQLGVRVVQFGPNLALYELPQQELDEVLAACGQHGIEVEVGTRGVETDHLKKLVEFTSRCGSKLLRTVPDMEAGQLAGRLRAIEPVCRAAGVRLALENSLMRASTMDKALAEVGSEWLGITLDTVNSLAIPEGTEEVAGRLAKWTCCLHVKDFIVRREWHMMGFRVDGRPAGQGQLDVPRLLGLLAAEGAKANAILELWPPEQATPAETIALEQRWAEESVTYLRTLIEE